MPPQVAIPVAEEVAEPALLYTGAFMTGSLQEVCWNQSDALGFFCTGLAFAGGAVGAMMVPGLGGAALRGVAAGGSTYMGAALTRKFLLGGGAPAYSRNGELPARARELAERMRRRLAPGRGERELERDRIASHVEI